MKIQRATIEITSINHYFQSTPDEGSWQLTLAGEFTKTSDSHIGGGPRFIFLEREVDLSNELVLVSLKPLPKHLKHTRKPASEPWNSNEDHRDAIRIDGLEEGGYIHSQISIYVDEQEIEVIKNVNLRTHQMLIQLQYIDNGIDPRPLSKPNTDHFFRYLSESTIHILSYKEGFYPKEYLPLLKQEQEHSEEAEELKNIYNTLTKIAEESASFTKKVRVWAAIAAILMVALLLKS